ncbi:MAG: flippase-like domain-containing protein [Bacteroidota bacterium]|nr:flippase-like domain-containing protein [Bacteroidota bacterium]
MFYSLYQQVRQQPNLQHSLSLIRSVPFGKEAPIFWLVVGLSFLNWGFEAKKWQLLVSTIQSFSFLRAFKSVLSGITLSLNTPNRMGEYGGRIIYVETGNRIKAISLSIAGSISQLIITLLLGCMGLTYMLFFQGAGEVTLMGLPDFWLRILLYLSVIITLLLLLFFFRLSWLIRLVEKIPASGKVVQYISVLDHFDAKLLLRLLFLSFLRYIVFVLQYILMLHVLQVAIPWMSAFWIITILFLVLAIVPSFAIADLGIRGKFSVELLGFYSANTIGIIGTTFGIWMINLFIPALAGSLLILNVKFFKDK